MKTQTLPLDYLESMSETLKILAHPQRLRILEYLDLNGECSAGGIIAALALDQSAGSQHLNKMRTAGLLRVRRDGTHRYFGIVNPHAITILNCMRNKYKETRHHESSN